MPSKIDRALGAFCLAFAAFFLFASRSIGDGSADAYGFGSATAIAALAIALLAAVPGIWLLMKGRTV